MIIQIVVGCFVSNKLGHLDNCLLLISNLHHKSLGVLKGIEILNEPFIFNQFEIVLTFIKRVGSMVEAVRFLEGNTKAGERENACTLTYLLAK